MKFCPCSGQEQQPREGNCKSLKLRGEKQSKAQSAAGWVCRVLTEGWVLLASAPSVPWHCSELCWDSSGVDSASRNCCPRPSSPLQSAVTSSLPSCGCCGSMGRCGSVVLSCASVLGKHVLSSGYPHLKPDLKPGLWQFSEPPCHWWWWQMDVGDLSWAQGRCLGRGVPVQQLIGSLVVVPSC